MEIRQAAGRESWPGRPALVFACAHLTDERLFAHQVEALSATHDCRTFRLIEIDVEHVGSPAVPGLAAKPIIDILLGASSLAQVESRIPHLEPVGYRYVPEFEKQLPQRRYFVKPARGEARFHLHAAERGSAFWRDQIRFRDALRHQPALCDRYVSLKRQLAASLFMDRAAYTDAKAPFIEAVLRDLNRRA